MAEIIAFPSPDHGRRQALQRLADKVAAHLVTLFIKRNVLHIPVQPIIKGMYENMLSDGFPYEVEVLEQIMNDPATIERIGKMCIDALKRNGDLPPEFH